ncbi:MAG TPA: AAA family ATPase, partial [Mycobacteriales bacterium]
MQGNDTLSQTVWELAEADPELTDDATLLVLAAMEGDSTLASLLDGTGGVLPEERTGTGEPATEPVGAFLRSITVSGFRGIGRQATLTLRPGPGLTVIAGRNGSGKSSFAEALEMALTGNSYRWKTRSKLWQDGWRNIHDGSDAQIRIRIAEEGAGDTTVGMDWAPDGGLEDRNVWVQRRGKPRQPGLDSLGWESALEVFRPILSYDELGGLLESGPSGLYDALAAMLGLEQVTDAQKRLDAAVKRLGIPQADAKALRTELKQTLTGMDDPRAATALTLLKKQHPDIDAVESLATGTVAAPADDLAGLRAITRIQVPHAAEVRQITEALREATDALVVSSTETVDLAERRTALLRDAVALHEQHGQMPCPVCGVGTLDGPWLTRAQTELSGEDDRLRELRQARERLAARRRAVAELV